MNRSRLRFRVVLLLAVGGILFLLTMTGWYLRFERAARALPTGLNSELDLRLTCSSHDGGLITNLQGTLYNGTNWEVRSVTVQITALESNFWNKLPPKEAAKGTSTSTPKRSPKEPSAVRELTPQEVIEGGLVALPEIMENGWITDEELAKLRFERIYELYPYSESGDRATVEPFMVGRVFAKLQEEVISDSLSYKILRATGRKKYSQYP